MGVIVRLSGGTASSAYGLLGGTPRRLEGSKHAAFGWWRGGLERSRSFLACDGLGGDG